MDLSMRINTVFRSLRYRNCRLFFSGQSISLIGTWMKRIAMLWPVYVRMGIIPEVATGLQVAIEPAAEGTNINSKG
jgi:hypothetical protein